MLVEVLGRAARAVPSGTARERGRAARATRVPSAKAAVTQALTEFIARRERACIKEPFGQLEWDDGYDYKAERDRG